MVNLDPEADLVRAPSANASVRRKGRPRSQKVHQAILQAALELVQEVGFSDLTIEGIATQAGTSNSRFTVVGLRKPPSGWRPF